MSPNKFYALACAIGLTGCASILGDPHQLIGLNSVPDQAAVVVTDESGQNIFSGTTPTTVLLKKSEGYFGGKTYKVRVEKPGYKPSELTLDTRVNGLYVAGNLLVGGLIGWLIVDPLTGAMYTITPEAVNANLEGEVTASGRELRFALLEDVPLQLRSQLQPLPR